MRKLAKLISFLVLLRFRLFSGGRIRVGKNVLTNFRLKISGKGCVEIGDNVNMWAFEEPNCFYTYTAEAVIKIGSGSRLNGVKLQARESIEVGKNCLIGSAIVMDNDFHHADPKRRFDKNDIPTKPVKIGNNVWLCGQSAVLKGVKIGDNSVVGFRAVVSKDVPENVAVAGNPAVLIKSL